MAGCPYGRGTGPGVAGHALEAVLRDAGLGTAHIARACAAGGQALSILINDVVRQPADRPVHADPLADQASVELRIAAIDEPDYPRAAIPAAVANPGALEYEPEALSKGRARRCIQLDRYLRGQMRRNPLIRVNEVEPSRVGAQEAGA